MTKNINGAVSLTSYFVALPKTKYLVLAIVLTSIVFGFLINIGSERPIHSAIIDGLTLLALPALLSILAVKVMIRKIPYSRIAATALAGEIVYAIAYIISLVLSDVNLFWAQFVLLIGAAVVFVLWYLIARFIFILKYRSIVFAILQLLFYLIFLVTNQAFYVSGEPFFDIAIRFYISSFVLLAAIILFFFIINAPMKKNFGLNSTDALSYFFSQWFYHNKDLEKAFEHIGEPVKTFVSVMGFKRKDDTVLFITPYVHFGPFGNLGGSEFSHLITEQIKTKYHMTSFVFHGTVTHDLNPVASSELDKIINAIDETIRNAKYLPASVSLQFGQADECRAEALVINNNAFIGVTRAPLVTEDINFGLGLSMMYNAERYVENAMIVDQHNAETGDITSFEPGGEIGYRYLTCVKNSFQRTAKQNKSMKLKIGVSSFSPTSMPGFPAMGGAGIRVAVLSSDPEYVIVLLDCNGVTPDFRARIEKELHSLGKSKARKWSIGVYTTDTHQVNMVRGVINPLKDEEIILQQIIDTTNNAFEDMQEAQFFADKKWFNINVLGAKQSIEIISTVNSIVAVAKITLPLILVGGVLLLLAIVTSI
ncbi:DUF2070 family protein [Candidatus Micrarchaeota archaeon]|nr:DUF2070 family protein [Candidatus Micrarchaeota archaeon]MBU1886997.1 DUF2070 family protein [Candidatus Micrarchaeota archaeon]